MIECNDVFTRQQDFIAAMAHSSDGMWMRSDGVTLYFQRLPVSSEIALCLTLPSGRRYAERIRQMLRQRFQQAETLGKCYLSMDAQQQLIVRHALPIAEESVSQTITNLLQLAALPPA
ncbi:hypothetical protein Bresa_01985|uniref:Uncharacterized protein n=1 Tax=Brenneria salicis ATCC 15712 = DSM 30166 TaxID=714314 RepID=A0A366I8H7_9GAMM|nr:type III secretion protein [Brenneria salicis]NMN91768.1 hypothetical protein [Brenneria salicis ATCC 15712 = DSM 30166]RBP65835.1 hypothetical protein DES54_104100 [Brenneria salicis ATCC 15712 = DSM 30166]RLM31870.1 hypothetical protein BHG07_03460 [Brenneria salicis ATCC 15712 = DSM 30166]